MVLWGEKIGLLYKKNKYLFSMVVSRFRNPFAGPLWVRGFIIQLELRALKIHSFELSPKCLDIHRFFTVVIPRGHSFTYSPS